MKRLIGILGWVWSAPYTLPTLLVTLVLVLFRQLEYVARTDYLMFVWAPRDGSWMARHFERGRWKGFGFGGSVFTTLRPDHARWREIIAHEETHSFQQYAFGPLFWVLYALIGIFIWLFMPNKHSYYSHPFEVQARRRAGQPIEISKEKWRDGPFDRWPWW